MTALHLNILILALGGLQGVLLFTLLFQKRKFLPGYIFLAAYLSVMILQVTMKIAGKVWLMQYLNPLYQFSYQLPFLYGPLLYLFICRFINRRNIATLDIFHFTPAIIVIAIFTFVYPSVRLPGFLLIFFNYKWTAILQVASIIIYHLISLRLIGEYAGSPAGKMKFLPGPFAIWMKQFIIISLISTSIVAVVICLMYFNNPAWSNVRFGFSALTIFIYWISFKVWHHPEVFGVIRGYNNDENERPPVPMLTVHLPAKKYSGSSLSDDEMRRIVTTLENKMQGEKLYLDPQLTVDQLSVLLGISKHHLSQAINEQMGKSFYDCVNFYRVSEAKVLLSDPTKSFYKIASIAFDSGFNSISTFNDVFKKITGQTPSGFRKYNEEERLKRQRV